VIRTSTGGTAVAGDSPPWPTGILLKVTDLLLGLGAAIVKVACKIWLKDNAFAADASADVVDVIKDRIAGELDQRTARRLFEDLEVPVAKKLASLREHEFAGMPDNEWTAAVLGVGDALRGARFTDADVFDGDLDPLYLRRKVVVCSPGATRDLSAAGAALYDRLLTECCAYVVELTSTLPRFSTGVFTEILRRQTAILERVTEVLDRMPAAGAAAAGAEQAEADFAAAYRRQVVSQLDRLELFGVTVSDSVRGYPLSTAYISLAVSAERLPFARRLEMLYGEPDDGGQPESLRIDKALESTSRLFLRGEAGSGKTTLLQWLAVRAARQDFSERLASWNDAVPFLVRLRRSVGRELPAPEAFVNEVGRHIAAEMPPGWVHRLLREGRALILVDGVDELPEGQRRAARDWLGGLVAAFPDARYVVTSRPGAAGSTWLDGQAFDAAEVQPMSWPDVQEFVRHWHAAFRAEASDQERRAQIGVAESALLESLYARRHLRLLATSPLLCALLCALNLDRRAQLPDERLELYAIALDMLLERRDAERLITADGPSLSKTGKTLLLEDLAYWLIRNGWSDAPRDRVTERLARRLAAMPRAGTQDGGRVLDGLIVRSGLLREPVTGRIDFVHRTFEEYLAARAAVGEDEVGELIRNADDDQWREVIVMAAGHAQPRQRDELLRGLLARAQDEPRKRQALQTLAVASLETSPQLDPELHARIQAVAESLLPPNGVRQAEVLARIGEPLLDLLAGRLPRGPRQAAATIRAASLVGGAPALRIIAACAGHDSLTVRRELMRAWSSFDVEEYARAVYCDAQCGDYLRIEDPALLPGIARIGQLKTLTLSFPESAHNDQLAIVRSVPGLTTLNIVNYQGLRNLDAVTGHPALEYVLLQGAGGPIAVSALSSLPRLRRVYVSADRVSDPSSLSRCAGLRVVALANLPEINQLARFLPRHHLDELELAKTRLRSLAELSGFPQLAMLSALTLRDTGSESLEGVGRWAQTLRRLDLSWGTRADIGPLVELPLLEVLSLWSVDENRLRVVRELSSLRELNLCGAGSVDLTALRGAPSLTVHVWRGQKVHGSELLGAGSKVVRG
jgi:hypothetical protein